MKRFMLGLIGVLLIGSCFAAVTDYGGAKKPKSEIPVVDNGQFDEITLVKQCNEIATFDVLAIGLLEIENPIVLDSTPLATPYKESFYSYLPVHRRVRTIQHK